MIPEAAVEAAHKAWRGQSALDGSILEYNLRAALEAAAPHMRQAFYLEMNLRAVEDELNTPLQLGRANRGDRT